MRKVLGLAACAASVVTAAAPAPVALSSTSPRASGASAVTDAGALGMASDGFYGGFNHAADREATYMYGPLLRQQLDAYWSDSGSRRAAVLLLHGGYWLHGDKTTWRGIARLLAARGYAVFAANYRLAGEAAWPAQREDALAALDYVKANAARFNLDPDRVIALGSSSGGQVATVLGTYGEGGKRVKGVVAVSPAASPYRAYMDGSAAKVGSRQHKLREATIRLVGCTPQQGTATCWERLEESVAANHVSGDDARMFLAHSTSDFVPSRHSIELGDRLKAAGIPVEIRILPGSAHGNRLLREPALFESVVAWIDRAVQN